MTAKSSRNVSVSLSGIGLLISLSWFGDDKEGNYGYQSIDLEYPKTGVIESVEKALNILVCETSRTFIQYDRVHVIYNVGKEEWDLFDMVADAEEPTQAFISKDILNYKDGMIAYHRVMDARMNEIIHGVNLSL